MNEEIDWRKKRDEAFRYATDHYFQHTWVGGALYFRCTICGKKFGFGYRAVPILQRMQDHFQEMHELRRQA